MIHCSGAGQFRQETGTAEKENSRSRSNPHIDIQHRKRPVGMTPPREMISGMSARQEMTMPPARHRRSVLPVPKRNWEDDGDRRRAAMMLHSSQRTGT